MSKYSLRKILFCIFVLCCCTTIGCGNYIRVSGSVTFPDGTPLETGIVNFQSPTHIAKGTLQKGGRFTIGTFKVADGLPPGEYKVFITGAQKVRPDFVPNPKIDDLGLISVIDERFSSPDQTPLAYTIEKKTTLNIVVDPAFSNKASQ